VASSRKLARNREIVVQLATKSAFEFCVFMVIYFSNIQKSEIVARVGKIPPQLNKEIKSILGQFELA